MSNWSCKTSLLALKGYCSAAVNKRLESVPWVTSRKLYDAKRKITEKFKACTTRLRNSTSTRKSHTRNKKKSSNVLVGGRTESQDITETLPQF